MSYIGIPPFGQTIRSITSTTATSGQTTFNITGGYVVGYVDVFLNGILLTPSDYTATNGTTVVLASGATTGDEFQALAYQPVSLVDTYRKSEVDSLINNIDALPTQTGQSGKYLTTDGTDASWGTVDLTSKVSKTGDTMTGALVTPMVVTDSSMNFRNRIINGDMRIDQRNAGAVSNPSGASYTVDRWAARGSVASKFTLQQSTTVPSGAGFVNSIVATSSSAYTVGAAEVFNIAQFIEGTNVSDLGWGTANAKTVTLSFWVRSSLTGTFGGSLRNSAADRSYPFTYTISVADTWEYKTVTVSGDTTGTWLTTTGIGIAVFISLGAGATISGTAGAWAGANYQSATGAVSVVGTNGATFYITGVQLEVGSVATPFERRPYGTELALCQRYYYMVVNGSSQTVARGGYNSSTLWEATVPLPVTMRATPTLSATSGTDYYRIYYNGTDDDINSLTIGPESTARTVGVYNNSQASGSAGFHGHCVAMNASSFVAFQSEL